MKTIVAIFAGAGLLLATTTASAETRAEKNEARVARMIEGRTAGEPVNCISALRSNSIEVIDHVGVVYDAGDTVYVARASDPRMLSTFDTLVINRYGSQLCTNDMMRTVDRYNGYITGVVFLEDFVPYTKRS
ncbi:MAG: hypothetical protein ABIT16_05940 [Croceibacterium sp.]